MRILLSGVGGQGILFVTRVLSELALGRGWSVTGAETHGMAQRGGSVVSHLKIGQDAAAPLIRKGTADLLLGLEENEGVRWVGYLRPGGRLLINSGKGGLDLPLLRAYLAENRLAVRPLPASRLAQEMGYPMGANLILLGAAVALKWVPFSPKETEKVVARISRSTLVGPNLGSLRAGWEQMAG
jgi:indolepyruvate ferredoxin oxidoreductase beta subunit